MLRLREERLRRGWSQTRLSALTEIAQSDLSAIENGLKPVYPGWRERLTSVFGMPADKLFAPVDEERAVASR